RGHDGWIMACVSLPEGRLASYDSGRSINIWKLSDGTCLRTIPAPPNAQLEYLTTHGLQAIFDKYLIAQYQKRANIWDPKTGACLQTIEIDDNITTHENRFVVNSHNQLIIGNDDGDT